MIRSLLNLIGTVMSSERLVLNYVWFSGRDCVGVVQVEDRYDGLLYYIGVAKGISEKEDAQYIADWGAKFPEHLGKLLFGEV